MYERILVPTDGSTGTAHVALQAIDLAEQYGATIHALHVVDETVEGLATDAGEQLRQQGRQAVDQIERMAEAHGVDAVTVLEEGDPAEDIVAYAEAEDVDLIVAGTHGRSGVRRRLIGSVAERLVRQAPCPVMTVRLPESDVTVPDADEARDIAREALADDGHDASVTGVERQESVWVVEATADDETFLVYVDPVTRRTSVIDRGSGR